MPELPTIVLLPKILPLSFIMNAETEPFLDNTSLDDNSTKLLDDESFQSSSERASIFRRPGLLIFIHIMLIISYTSIGFAVIKTHDKTIRITPNGV